MKWLSIYSISTHLSPPPSTLCQMKEANLEKHKCTSALRIPLNALYCIEMSAGGENKKESSVYSISEKEGKGLNILQVLLSSTVNLSLWKISCDTSEIANHGLLCMSVCFCACERESVHVRLWVCVFRSVCCVPQNNKLKQENTCWAEDAFLHFKLMPKSTSPRCHLCIVWCIHAF